MDAVRLRVSVSGVVQGVGFRAFARRYARTLGLVGYAHNQSDGTVEVVAEGSQRALEQFLPVLKRGSPSGRVDGISFSWEVATGEFTGFTVG